MFEISELQKRDLLKYLAQRPYIELAALVNMIASLKLIKKDEKGKVKQPLKHAVLTNLQN